MAKSSINFQKSKGHSAAHNFREDEPKYLLPLQHREKNEYWRHEKSAQEIFTAELAKYDGKGKRPRFENSHWEGVLNLNAGHTLEAAQKVAKHIEQKFNITCTAIAIHRDEGHINERGTAERNLHAHLNFVTVKDRKQNWTLSKVKHKLPELQTEIAGLLEMERGKEKSEAVRLSHRQYKAQKQQEQAYTAEKKEKTGHDESQAYNFREMQKRITALEALNAEQKKELHRLNTQVNKGELDKQELEARLTEVTTGKQEAISEAVKSELKSMQKDDVINELKAENTALKEENSRFIKFVDYVKTTAPIIYDKAKNFLGIGEKRTERGQISTNGITAGKYSSEDPFVEIQAKENEFKRMFEETENPKTLKDKILDFKKKRTENKQEKPKIRHR